MRKRTTALLLVLAAVAVTALPVAAATPKLPGSVGPGFTIALKKPAKPGKYTLVIADRSDEHNFHLKGKGVNVKTGIAAVRTKSFAVTLVKARYTFLCDAHPTTMKGAFTIR